VVERERVMLVIGDLTSAPPREWIMAAHLRDMTWPESFIGGAP